MHEKIYDRFMDRALARVDRMKQGNPLHDSTMVGAQASNDQMEKILSYIDIGKQEGAKVLIGGGQAKLGGGLENGFYVQPTVLEGHNKMRVFQEEIFGPVLAVTDSRMMTRRSPSPTTRCTASAPASGRATSIVPIASAGQSRRGASGPTATTSTRRTRPSGVTSSPASGARTIR